MLISTVHLCDRRAGVKLMVVGQAHLPTKCRVQIGNLELEMSEEHSLLFFRAWIQRDIMRGHFFSPPTVYPQANIDPSVGG
jgi:hypothetical protein